MDEDIKGRVLDLAGLLRYQEGAIVSKVFLRQKTGSISLFAFAKGQELSEHTAPFDALVHVLEGEVDVLIAGKSNILKTGEIIIMPANIAHALRARTDFKMLLSMIKP